MKMKNNMGKNDRIARLVIGVVLLAAGAFYLTGLASIVGMILGVVLLLTSALNWCPIYALLGISTAHK